MRHLVARLTLAAAALVIAAVVGAALVLDLLAARAQLRDAAEADLSALVSLAEATADDR